MSLHAPSLMNCPVQRVSYGAAEAQFVDFYLPLGNDQPAAILMLVHGGFWRQRFDLTLMNPIAAEALNRRMAVANVEYRRVGNDGGWPATSHDVGEALATVRQHWSRWSGTVPFVSVGHSVGGQLALLNATPADAIVAIAPITDLVRTERERLGEDAAVQFMAARAIERPLAYAAASPFQQLPVHRSTLVIHGSGDNRVPAQHSRDFASAALDAGDELLYWEIPGLDHMQAIDPSTSHWIPTFKWMVEQRPLERRSVKED